VSVHTTTPIPLRPAHNLTAQYTSFVGREHDLAEIIQLLRGQARLVTLTGAGGVGKTRLAQEAGGDLLGDFGEGVWLVELGPLSDRQRVPQAVAAAVGVQEEPGRELLETLVAALRPRQLLLILDNCEHLLQASAQLVVRLLSGCPRVSILATSREPLGLAGEVRWRVPSLERPELGQDASLDHLLHIASTRLFAERATAACPGFDAAENVAAMAQICQRLDGIPLALELAAARVSALGVQQIAARLDDCFRVLGRGSSAAPARQQTLRATIDWSYDLLVEREQRLLERLAVFAGGWTLDAAESICGFGDVAAPDVVDLLSRLVDKSLVIAEDGARHYRLLETVRAYALERLRASGAESMVRARHLDWYTSFALRTDHVMRRATDLPWSARAAAAMGVVREIDNLRAAWQWSIGDGDVDQGMRLAAGLLPFFYSVGYLGEGRDWLARSLATTAGLPPTIAYAEALSAATKLAANQGDDAATLEYASAYQALPDSLHSPAASADMFAGLAIVGVRLGDPAVAYAHGLTAVELALANGDPINATLYRTYVATAALADNRVEEAAALYQQSVIEARALDFQLGVAVALDGLATLARMAGDMTAARGMYEEALAVFRATGAVLPATQAMIGSAYTALDLGDLGSAQRGFGEALDLGLAVGQRQQVVNALDGLILVAAAQRRPERVARMLGATAGLRAVVASPPLSAALSAAQVGARRQLGSQRADALVAEGAAMTVEQAIACAREVGPPVAHDRTASGRLTERELEVVRLLGRGLANRQIAQELVISVRTVDRHVENILGKLELTSRGQIIRWASERGLLVVPTPERH
jgi:predicted ATPase/DNA-binding NarL/FixJ family response regulator